MAKPLAIDLFAGLGGWTEGFLAEGYDVVGFDNERHVYGDQKYPAHLVLQDVLTLSGRQFRNAAVIVASPPCQAYSYMAMPWSRAKELVRQYEADVTRQLELNCLFNACFRIAHEAQVPLVVENVKGAQRWVGSAKWNVGPYFLWGDIPALMGAIPYVRKGMNCGRSSDGKRQYGGPNDPRRFNSKSKERRQASAIAAKIPLPLAQWIARCFKP